jgi:hypothetical protein
MALSNDVLYTLIGAEFLFTLTHPSIHCAVMSSRYGEGGGGQAGVVSNRFPLLSLEEYDDKSYCTSFPLPPPQKKIPQYRIKSPPPTNCEMTEVCRTPGCLPRTDGRHSDISDDNTQTLSLLYSTPSPSPSPLSPILLSESASKDAASLLADGSQGCWTLLHLFPLSI